MSKSASLLLRAGTVIAGVVISAIAVRLLREPQWLARQQTTRPAGLKEPAAITLPDIRSAYQGPIQQKDRDEGWLILTLTPIDTASDPVRFRYTLNGFSKTAKALMERGEDGELSLTKGTIRFGTFTGRIRRDGRGRVVLQSNQIDGPPYWQLEPAPVEPES